MPTALEVDHESGTEAYGKFVAKPLERGWSNSWEFSPQGTT